MDIQKIYNKPKICLTNPKHNVYIFYQFFIHSNLNRDKEIKYTLRKNMECPHIDKIVLLNERSYTNEEYNITEEEREKHIEEIIVKDRLSYDIFFNHASKYNGYVILCNSDIYFNDTLQNIHKTHLPITRCCYANLRIEQNQLIFGPRSDSQDSWMFYSKFLPKKLEKYKIVLGKPGCDNAIIHHLKEDNYIIYNEPLRIQTIHVHETNIRNYDRSDLVQSKYAWVYPHLSYHINGPREKNITFNMIMSTLQENKPISICYLEKYYTQFAIKLTYSYDLNYEFRIMQERKLLIRNKDELNHFRSNYCHSIMMSDFFYMNQTLDNPKLLDILNIPVIYSHIMKKPIQNQAILTKYCRNQKPLFIIDNEHPVEDNNYINLDQLNKEYIMNYTQSNNLLKKVNIILYQKKKDYNIVICFSKTYMNILPHFSVTTRKLEKTFLYIPDIYCNFKKSKKKEFSFKIYK